MRVPPDELAGHQPVLHLAEKKPGTLHRVTDEGAGMTGLVKGIEDIGGVRRFEKKHHSLHSAVGGVRRFLALRGIDELQD